MSSENEENVFNILKSRDDKELIYFEKIGEEFQLKQDMRCAWAKPKKPFNLQTLRQRIEPWLTALFQSEHLSLLIGSGLSIAVSYLAGNDNPPAMGGIQFEVFDSQIQEAANRTAESNRRKTPNFEDQIRVANELLLGLDHYSVFPDQIHNGDDLKNKLNLLEKDLSKILGGFAKDILSGELESLSDTIKGVNSFNYLVNFLMSPSSRTGTRDRLQIFTTNYDRFIEAGAELAGLHLIDRFVGNISPLFRSSRLNLDMHYNPPGIRGEPRYLEGVVRFTKLHGSVDWVYTDREIRRIGLPFGAIEIEPFLKAPSLKNASPLNLMIYPNSAKDRETSAYPYVELFRDFAAAICRPNSTLVIYGYGFGDEHINRVIEDMLTIPSTHLVIISFSDPVGRINGFYNSTARKAQITFLVGNVLGDLTTLVDHFLPKPAIDKASLKMADLLKTRLGFDIGASEEYKEGEEK